MARNGSGTYSLAEAAFVNDTVIDEVAVNSVLSDIATALTESIARDGQTPTTAKVPFGTFGISSDLITEDTSAAGVTIDSVLLKDGGVQLGSAGTLVFEGATADAFETTLTVTDPTADRTVTFPDASGTIIYNVLEDTTPQLGGPLDTNDQAVNLSEGSAVASATTADIWATDGNTVHVTGTTTITSFGTAPRAGAWRTVIFDGILTLTHGANLNLPGAANITTAAGDIAFVYADTTTQFDVVYHKASGAAVVATGLPAPDFTSAEQAITLDSDLDVAHSLGAIPTLFQVVLRCKSAELGYEVGDEVPVESVGEAGVADRHITPYANATNVSVRTGVTIILLDSGFDTLVITFASWKYVVRAWA